MALATGNGNVGEGFILHLLCQVLFGCIDDHIHITSIIFGYLYSSSKMRLEYIFGLVLIFPYISAKVLASIGDPFRFENTNQVIRMVGYDLCANRSGKTSHNAIPVISKKGNGELRYALYQAALIASSRTDLFRAYFTKLLRGRERERGIKTKMRVKLAVKMLIIAWTLMKKKEPFDPKYLNID